MKSHPEKTPASDTQSRNEPVYTISDLASEFDVTPRTIRYYEEVGLLDPLRTRETNQRIYGPKDRVRLKLILRGRRLGFSLEDIKDMLDLYDADPTEKEQLRKTIEHGERRLAEIDRMIEELTLIKEEILEFRERFMALLEEKES